MRKLLRISAILCFLIFMPLFCNYAYSCICFIPELDEHFSESDQVFSAKVLWIEDEDHFYPTYDFGDDFVTLEIVSNYKNVPDEAIGTRISVIVSSACPYKFELDKEYIIFGTFASSKNILFVGECSVIAASSFDKWTELEKLSDISKTEKPQKETDDSPTKTAIKKNNLIVIVLVLISIISIGLNLYLFLAKRK